MLEQNELDYPKGHLLTKSEAEHEILYQELISIEKLTQQQRANILITREYAFSVLIALDGNNFAEADYNDIAYYVTGRLSKGRRITKANRIQVDTNLKPVLVKLLQKEEIELNKEGKYYTITKKGLEKLSCYKNANVIYKNLIRSLDREITLKVIHKLSFSFFCNHNAITISNPFGDNADAEKVGLHIYHELKNHGVLKEFNGFKELGITNEDMYYMDGDTYMHFAKLLELRKTAS